MNPFEMVVAIIAVVMVASVLRARYKARHGIVEDEHGNERIAARDFATRAMTAEVQALKERIAVLERLATDEHGSRALDREIEKLR